MALYQAIIQADNYQQEPLANLFVKMYQTGIPVDETGMILYQAVIQVNNYQQKPLANLFVKMYQAGIPVDETGMKLYQTVIKADYNAEGLAESLVLLYQASISVEDIANYFLNYLIKDYSPKELALSFIELHKNNIYYKEKTAELYKIISKINSCYCKNVVCSFALLSQMGFPYNDENTMLYEQVVKNKSFADRIIKNITILKAKNFLNKSIYIDILKELTNVANYELENVLMSCKSLQESGFSSEGNGLKYYQYIIKHHFFAKDLACKFIRLKNSSDIPYKDNGAEKFYFSKSSEEAIAIFHILKKFGIQYKDNKLLYQDDSFINPGKQTAEKLSRLLELLKQTGVTYSSHSNYFNINTLILYSASLLSLLDRLNQLGFSSKHHEFIYHAVIHQVALGQSGTSTAMQIVKSLKDYMSKNALADSNSADFSKQSDLLKEIIENTKSQSNSLTQGPLNKKQSTLSIENLLQYLTDIILNVESNKTVEVYFSSLEHYMLVIKNRDVKEEIDLTLLLRNANLTHLTLSDELINNIGTVIQQLIGQLWNQTDCFGNYSSLLDSDNTTEAMQANVVRRKVLGIYNSGYSVTHINRLFLSETIKNDKIYMLATDPTQDALASFLLGCIVSDSVNKLYNEDAIQKNPNQQLTRYLTLTPRQAKALSASRYASFPANASCSFHRGGCGQYDSKDSTTITIPNPPYYNKEAIKPHIAEAILPHGESGIVEQVTDRHFMWTIARSPSLDPSDHYRSEQALTYAFNHHLKHSYKGEESFIIINEQRIERPNHAMPHTYEVMSLIKPVINYFGAYAKDEAFKTFCQDITAEKIEWLLVDAAFSVTGRESEWGFSDNKEAYLRYRAASRDNFIAFAKRTAPEGTSADVIQQFADIVWHMGDPEYVTIGPNTPQECKANVYYQRILNLAHNINLMRCWGLARFKPSMQASCHAFSTESPAQHQAYVSMLQYNAEHIKAHGGQLLIDVTADGELEDVYIPYQDHFAEASSSVKGLFEMTQTVPKPDIKSNIDAEIYSAPSASN